MESSTSKEEALKPVILKTSIPLAVTFGGLIYTWIKAKRCLSKAPSLSANEAISNGNNSQQGEESCLSLASMEEDEGDSAFGETSVIHDYSENPCFEEEINSLRSQIEGMKMKELALRLQFDQFCGLREQELELGEIKNALSLEIARIGFLDREISSMEAEHKRLEDWRSENKLLRKRFKKLQRRSMAQYRIVKEQALMIKAEEAEILRCHDELRMKVNVIDELEDEIKKLQRELDQLQDHKNELLKKIDTLERLHASKIEVSREDYNRVVDELDHVKKEQADEAKELIHLRWTNACLRHEITRHHDNVHQHQHGDNNIELEPGGGSDLQVTHYDSDHDQSHDDDGSSFEHQSVSHFGSFRHGNGTRSKSGKLLRKIKRWVEGTETSKTSESNKNIKIIRYGFCLRVSRHFTLKPFMGKENKLCNTYV
ncbi:protein CHUP1, chloroplastic-like isoform X2 [Arachis ipaensis]|uniref:protein CHUP1, chloroplastic-like isoform X2 n=1 Tax=Arachis ipaensis TaxID=130454 RepID=UPI000A2B645E|nr:protein CHUP1, chloroplastic-like isoform X2 [Arachis ipaensis]